MCFNKKNIPIITRAHRFDVYKERRPLKYMPIKWQFSRKINRVYAISQEGKEYLSKTYKINKEKVLVSRLGVSNAERINYGSTDENQLNIISISYCVPVKRIDKIIDSLSLIIKMNKSLKINWTHYGDGPLKDALVNMASKKLKENIKWKFAGYYNNRKLLEEIANIEVDLLINTSESEGVPVSIMEALARGIPVIAPEVGGIPEQIVNGINGFLLPENPSPNKIANVIIANISFFKDKSTRITCYEKWKNNYSAEKNYNQFINELLQIIDINNENIRGN